MDAERRGIWRGGRDLDVLRPTTKTLTTAPIARSARRFLPIGANVEQPRQQDLATTFAAFADRPIPLPQCPPLLERRQLARAEQLAAPRLRAPWPGRGLGVSERQALRERDRRSRGPRRSMNGGHSGSRIGGRKTSSAQIVGADARRSVAYGRRTSSARRSGRGSRRFAPCRRRTRRRHGRNRSRTLAGPNAQTSTARPVAGSARRFAPYRSRTSHECPHGRGRRRLRGSRTATDPAPLNARRTRAPAARPRRGARRAGASPPLRRPSAAPSHDDAPRRRCPRHRACARSRRRPRRAPGA